MRRLLLVAVLVLVASSAAGTGSPGGSVHARWVISDLGNLGGNYNSATGINERGQVVGSSRKLGGARHVVFWEAGLMRDLGELHDGPWLNEQGQVVWVEKKGRGALRWKDGRTMEIPLHSVAAMNDRGQIVGTITTAPSTQHAALWDGRRVRDLGVLPGDTLSAGLAVNDSGAVLGQSYTASGKMRGFLWQNGKMRNLGSLPGILPGFRPAETDCWTVAVNHRFQVLGICATHTLTREHVFLWQDGKLRDLGSLGLPALLNDRGDVVGATGAGRSQAFFWRNGTTTNLGTLGGRDTYALALNNRGQVVGEGRTKTGGYHAFVWEDGKLTDLGTLAGGRYSRAHAINDNGQIVGESVKPGYNAPSSAVLWTLRPGS